MALANKDGRIRPIAIGLTLRRAISQAKCIQMLEASIRLLEPHQLGVGSRDGATAAAQAVQSFLNNGGCGLMKIDFRNAFNELSGSALIEALKLLTPELSQIAHCLRTSLAFDLQ